KVYDEVRRKLSGISFTDGGAQKLKNIEDPVTIYHVGDGVADGAPLPPALTTPALATPVLATPVLATPVLATPPRDRPLAAVQPIRVISGDDEVKALAEGLAEAIESALTHNTSIAVTSGDPAGADFTLRGTVQAAGRRLRLTFGLDEKA